MLIIIRILSITNNRTELYTLKIGCVGQQFRVDFCNLVRFSPIVWIRITASGIPVGNEGCKRDPPLFFHIKFALIKLAVQMVISRIVDILKFIRYIVVIKRILLVAETISALIHMWDKGKVLIPRSKRFPAGTIVIGVFIIIDSNRQLFIHCYAIIFHHGIYISSIPPVRCFWPPSRIIIESRIFQ